MKTVTKWIAKIAAAVGILLLLTPLSASAVILQPMQGRADQSFACPDQSFTSLVPAVSSSDSFLYFNELTCRNNPMEGIDELGLRKQLTTWLRSGGEYWDVNDMPESVRKAVYAQDYDQEGWFSTKAASHAWIGVVGVFEGAGMAGWDLGEGLTGNVGDENIWLGLMNATIDEGPLAVAKEMATAPFKALVSGDAEQFGGSAFGLYIAGRQLHAGGKGYLKARGAGASRWGALKVGMNASPEELSVLKRLRGPKGRLGLSFNESHGNFFRRTVLESGDDIPVPAGSKNIRQMMADVSASNGREVALLRLKNGQRVLRMGSKNSIDWSDDISRMIGHTHPSGSLRLSEGDVLTSLKHLNQARSMVIVDPRTASAVRLSIRKEIPLLWPDL